MAHKKGVGSTDNGRDSKAQYLGVKMFGGQYAKAGNILVRQRGTKFHAGENVYLSKDHTIHAAIAGIVGFKRTKENRRIVFISPAQPKVGTLQEVKETLDVPAAAAMITATPAAAVAVKSGDDLKKIEGIGPKIEELLQAAGITTYAQLAAAPLAQLIEVLEAAGSRFLSHDPTTWPQQAALAAAGDWSALKTLQDSLQGGRA